MIYAGDWNVALEEMDIYNYKSHRNCKNVDLIKKQMRNKNLIDIWRLQNPIVKRFTLGTKKPFKRARLDFFLVSEDTLGLSPLSTIHVSYRSDHHMISLQLKLSNYTKGKGSWKFNNSLLNNNDFIKLIKSEISLIRETYALPIYNPEIVSIIKDTDLEIMIPDTLFIDTLLCQLRGTIISF